MITNEEFKAEVAILDREVKALEAMLPPQIPQIDPVEVAEAIVHTFSDFAFLSFEDNRRLLRGAILLRR